MDTKPTHCSRCHATFPESELAQAGYATVDGARICNACSEKLEKEFMGQHDVMTVYLSGDGQRVTSWLGAILGTVISKGRVGSIFGGSRHAVSVRVRAFDGAIWYARVARPGMCARLHRAKGAR